MNLVVNKDIFYKIGDLDESICQNIVQKALQGMDDGELYMQFGEYEGLSLEDGKVRDTSYQNFCGFGLRSVLGEVTGFAHSSLLDQKTLKEAAQTVSQIKTTEHAIFKPLDVSPAKHKLYSELNPIGEMNFDAKIQLLTSIDAYIRAASPYVKQVYASIFASYNIIKIMNIEGKTFDDIIPLIGLSISITVEKNGRKEDAFEGTGGRKSIKIIANEQNWKQMADEVLRKAITKLDSIAAPAGQLPVILGSGWPGILLHEAVGHGLEADFNRKKTSVYSEMLGKQIASELVTVVDDGTIPERRGSLNFDDEGTPTARNVLIENGTLVNYMQDRMNARLMKMKPTGNGRRQSYANLPMPRMTNTFMLPGKSKKEDLINSVKKGIYAVGFNGGQVDITSGKFVFTATESYLIEDGKVTSPLKGVTLIGTGADVMKKVVGVADDLEMDNGIGSCGKNGQSVPVGVGQPTVLIESITIGGTDH